MPVPYLKKLSDSSGTPLKELEASWEKAKEKVREEYKDISEDDTKFFALTTAIFKKMQHITEDGEGIVQASNTTASMFTDAQGNDTHFKTPTLDTVSRSGTIKKPKVKRAPGYSRMTPSLKAMTESTVLKPTYTAFTDIKMSKGKEHLNDLYELQEWMAKQYGKSSHIAIMNDQTGTVKFCDDDGENWRVYKTVKGLKPSLKAMTESFKKINN